MITFIT